MMGTGLAPYILEGKVLKTTNFGPNDLIILSVFFHVIIFTFSANRRGFLDPLFGWNLTQFMFGSRNLMLTFAFLFLISLMIGSIFVLFVDG
jgi:hypothetical protein